MGTVGAVVWVLPPGQGMYSSQGYLEHQMRAACALAHSKSHPSREVHRLCALGPSV